LTSRRRHSCQRKRVDEERRKDEMSILCKALWTRMIRSMCHGMSQLILLTMRVVPISWILDFERHLVACSTLVLSRGGRLQAKTLSQTRALVEIQQNKAAAATWRRVRALCKRMWQSTRSPAPKVVLSISSDLTLSSPFPCHHLSLPNNSHDCIQVVNHGRPLRSLYVGTQHRGL